MEETPAVLVHCRTSDNAERSRLRDEIRDKVRSITGMNCVVELVPPRTLPRTSSGKLSRSKARISICQARFSPTTSPPDVEVVRWEGLGGVWRSGRLPPTVRSDASRGGKEGVRRCRYRWAR